MAKGGGSSFTQLTANGVFFTQVLNPLLPSIFRPCCGTRTAGSKIRAYRYSAQGAGLFSPRLCFSAAFGVGRLRSARSFFYAAFPRLSAQERPASTPSSILLARAWRLELQRQPRSFVKEISPLWLSWTTLYIFSLGVGVLLGAVARRCLVRLSECRMQQRNVQARGAAGL